jgi:hypothetical protein
LLALRSFRLAGHEPLLDHRLLLPQDHLVLLLGDVRAGIAASMLALVIGSRSRRAFSRRTGTVCYTCSVVTYLRSRTRPRSRWAVPTRSSSSERVMASSVVAPDTSRPTVPRLAAFLPVATERSVVS